MPGKEFWENGRDKHENGGLAFKMPPKKGYIIILKLNS